MCPSLLVVCDCGDTRRRAGQSGLSFFFLGLGHIIEKCLQNPESGH
jgi:hypothetical protein